MMTSRAGAAGSLLRVRRTTDFGYDLNSHDLDPVEPLVVVDQLGLHGLATTWVGRVVD
jgi:hypothetical protein